VFIVKYLLLIFCLVLCFCNCKEPYGLCSDPPKLSKNELLFSVHGGSDSVVVDDPYWWLNGGVSYNYGVCEYIGTKNDPDYCNNNYCMGNGRNNSVMKIECSWFSVTRTSEYTLTVFVSQNETEGKMEGRVSIRAGNCVSGFSITRSAE
jgi:hypothetical protein